MRDRLRLSARNRDAVLYLLSLKRRPPPKDESSDDFNRPADDYFDGDWEQGS